MQHAYEINLANALDLCLYGTVWEVFATATSRS